jgi:hypothetical protein
MQIVINSDPNVRSLISDAALADNVVSSAPQTDSISVFQPDEVSIESSQSEVFTTYDASVQQAAKSSRDDEIYWGDMTRREYFDIFKALTEKLNNTDLSMLTPAEKYQYIYDMYSEVYGVTNDPYSETGIETHPGFRGKIATTFGSWSAQVDANRDRLYGNMSTTEIIDSISSKYPSAKKITLNELIKMGRELSDVGIGGGELSQIISDYQEIMERNGVTNAGALPVQWQLIVERYGVHNGSASLASQPSRGLAMMEAGITISKMLGRDITSYKTTDGSNDMNMADLIRDAVSRMYGSYEDYDNSMEEAKNSLDEFWDEIFERKEEAVLA